MSFRTKLLLAIVAVATGATLATMVPAQRALQAAQERALHERFRQQNSYARRFQERRLSAVAERCRALAQSVRLLAAVAEGDSQLIYDNARDELREVLAGTPGTDGGGKANGGIAAGLPRADFVRFVAADGHMYAPASTDQEFGTPAGGIDEIIAAVRASLKSSRTLDYGWISATDLPDPDLYEIVISAIEDPVDGRRLGAVVLGFRVSAVSDLGLAGERDWRESKSKDMDAEDDVSLGLFVGDRMRLDAVSDEDRETLTHVVSEHVGIVDPQTLELRHSIGGVPHLVFLDRLETSPAFQPAYRIGLYSLAGAQAERRQLQQRAVTLLLLVLGGGLLAGAALAYGLATPVRNLTAATGRIRAGDFDARVPVRSHDELGQLSESFNDMAVGLAQKDRYRRVLDMVADREVAEQLMAGREVGLSGEDREVSILFCDIRGFTALASELTAEEVVSMLNEHMTALTRVVHAHHGVVDKFVGDLIMAVFGAPKSYGDDAANAVRCATEMLRERATLNRSAKHAIEVGIGVTTGHVIAGCTGSADRLSYTVLGTPVNLVARLCAQARAGQIVIDETTRARVADVVEVVPLAPMELKGFKDPVAAYRVASLDVRGTARSAS